MKNVLKVRLWGHVYTRIFYSRQDLYKAAAKYVAKGIPVVINPKSVGGRRG